jgi:hypothetical protein
LQVRAVSGNYNGIRLEIITIIKGRTSMDQKFRTYVPVGNSPHLKACCQPTNLTSQKTRSKGLSPKRHKTKRDPTMATHPAVLPARHSHKVARQVVLAVPQRILLTVIHKRQLAILVLEVSSQQGHDFIDKNSALHLTLTYLETANLDELLWLIRCHRRCCCCCCCCREVPGGGARKTSSCGVSNGCSSVCTKMNVPCTRGADVWGKSGPISNIHQKTALSLLQSLNLSGYVSRDA